MQPQTTPQSLSRPMRFFLTSIGVVYAFYTYAFFYYFSKNSSEQFGSTVYWVVEIVFILSVVIRLFLRRNNIAEETGVFLSNIAFRYLGIFGLVMIPLAGMEIFQSGIIFNFLNRLGENLALISVKALVDLFVFGGMFIIWALFSSLFQRRFIQPVDTLTANDSDYFDGNYS